MRATNCSGSGWDPAPRSKRLRLCSRPIRPVCRGSLSNLDWVMSRGVNGWRRPVMHPVRGLAPVAGSSGCHDRAAFLGTSGFGPLDNISVLERFEEGARRWSAAHGGSVVELHAYALVEELDDRAVKDRLLAELHRVYPELKGASIVAEEWLINDDCPLLGTGPWGSGDRTPHPRIMLAGDGIRCDFPVALMERAATTGFLAANQLLIIYGLAGHDLWTVPMRSRHRLAAPLHRLLAR